MRMPEDVGGGNARPVAEHAVVRILAGSSTLADAAAPLLEAIEGSLGWPMGAIWEIDEEAAALRCVGAWQAPGIEAEAFEERSRSISFAPGVGLPGRVWATGEPAWIADVTEDQNFPRWETARAAGLHGAFAFPITSSQRVLGVIEFFTDEVRAPDPEVLDTMAALGGQIGQFVERMRVEEEVRRSEALKTAIVESALDCVITIDHEGRITEFNPAAEANFGYARDEAIGQVMADLIIPPALREHHSRALDRYLATGQARVLDRRLELTAMRKDGSEFPVELTVTRVGSYEPPMFAGYVRDITDRKRNEDALRFLAEVSATLDGSLELDATLRSVARVAVPQLADVSTLYLRREDGAIQAVAGAAAGAEVEQVLAELRALPIDPAGPHPAATAIREGRTSVVTEVGDDLLESLAGSARHLELLRSSPEPGRGAVVPLDLRGRVLGAVSFSYLGARPGPGPGELSLMEEIGRRSATAIDNARLYTESSQAARALQRSLLPARLPAIPGVELAARFRPGGSERGIGGDFYDAFEARGRLVVAIGDSYGKGTHAAATTALLRYTLRAAATREEDPARILEALNEALRWELQEPRFGTVAIGVVEREGGEAWVALASGGHPLPFLLRSDGQVGPVGVPGTLLGVVDEPSLREERVRFKSGDALVFYTDGVIEGRAGDPRPLDELAASVRSCARLDADSIGERIDRRVASARGEEPRDDAVVLVVRLVEPGPAGAA